jgi:endonuclease G
MVSLGTLASGSGTVSTMAVGPRTTPIEEFEGREGYDAAFLDNFKVDLPARTGVRKGDEAPLIAGGNPELHYEHFSLVMSKSRRIAMFTACNIDGAKSKKIKRDKDVWALDGRIDARYQLGEDFYAGNRLDRGHLVRREDPVWGGGAALANDDTFHFTNCSPQYDEFNQQIWLGLENYLLKNARVHKLQISVFTGPVLRNDDPPYRMTRIPREYWKVVCLVTEGGRASATAYKISQEDLLSEGMAFVFGKYKTYQVSVSSVEKLAVLDFGRLRDYDGFSTQETMTAQPQQRVLEDWRDILI